MPIVAPFDGRVIARNLTKGEVVETTEKLFVVADLSEVWVMANIPEKDIPYIRPDRASAGSVGRGAWSCLSDEVFHGRITYVGDVLDPATRTMNLAAGTAESRAQTQARNVCDVRVYSEPETECADRARNRRCNAIATGTFVFVQRDAADV